MKYPSKEYSLLSQLSPLLNFIPSKVYPVGIGDDASIMKCSDGNLRIITADTAVENVHFSLDYMTFRETGYRAMVTNVSDCAAMGAQPESALIQLVIPHQHASSIKNIKEIYAGFRKACRRWGFPIIGGDLSKGPCWMIAITMIGIVAKGSKPVMRKGIKHGDSLWATGKLGESAAGLAVLKKWGRAGAPSAYSSLIHRHLSPSPRIEIGKALAKNPFIHAMMDVSDGIGKDCATLCYDNNLGINIEFPKDYASKPMQNLGKALKIDPLKWLISGGEDYELLFAASPGFNPDTLRKHSPIPITKLGVFDHSLQGLYLKNGGILTEIASAGWDHLV
jgi:thiamine-monophosphate kinase